ncbi:hypothetical protein [Streptomyces sp. NPDC059080]|uniref:hypothetical protein n=1 Tax=Streptomyces sp. NPDC059080 TaxID=3346718 RepID=UPI00368C6806
MPRPVSRLRRAAVPRFVQVLCVDRLTEESCTRTEPREVCIGAVVGALRPLPDEDAAPECPADAGPVCRVGRMKRFCCPA